ncbi:MAG: metallopeptidase TldD-related protein [Pseudomonadota bacterium]|nr:metallopeptidase TldD-related protein [Pseudomonadota bacterium]
MPAEMLELLQGLLKKAEKAGADAGDAVHIESRSLSVGQRLGAPEKLERSESADLGLRVLVGNKQAIVSSSDISDDALAALAERAVAMADVVPEDPYCGLADPDQLIVEIPNLDMCDPEEPDAETLIDWANRAEDAARAVKGVTNSEGAEAGWGQARVSVIASNGFAQSYAGSHYSLSASVLAGSGTEMERDYDYSGAVYRCDLESPEEIGKSAGERTTKRLNPKKVASGQVPVVYDPRVSKSLISHFANAINGSAIARETSFLKESMGSQVFSAGVNIIDDPHRHRGLRSKPFDGEGVSNKRRSIIKDGNLTTWFLDLRSARQLGLESTGHASRGAGSPPSPSATNLYMEKGLVSREELIGDIKAGLYVTELIGFGVNGLTGDYSRGAAGFWIEDGVLAYPVSEVTIAGNLKDMFLGLTAADDLSFRYGVDAPTVRIEEMTLAGV